MTYRNLSRADILNYLTYNRETGDLFWVRDISKKVKAGQKAGSSKNTRPRGRTPVFYRNVKINGMDIPAAQIAWLIEYHEWPTGRLQFNDKNTENLAISNLSEQDSLTQKFDWSGEPDDIRKEYMRTHRGTYPLEWKERDLKKKFDIGMKEYIEMAITQNNTCAICHQPERQMRGETLKLLAVDHCHATGKIRGLLCVACNKGLGQFDDNEERLSSAISYLKKSRAVLD